VKRKICVVTGTRAEFGLMYWLIKAINEDNNLELQLVVTGMHLSPEFGLTYKQIEEAGFPICRKVEILLSSDSPIGISKSLGLAQISFGETFDQLKPDIVLILGDRFEMFSVASAAMIARIPIAHLHGGEATEGLIDESIRHSITKMSHLHFTATQEYANRVIQLGENPDYVFNVGSCGMDNIFQLKLLSKNEFEESIGFKLGKKNIIVTFHPVTLEFNTALNQFNELLNAIQSIQDLHVIFTKPNADTEGRGLIDLIDKFVLNNPERYCSFVSLGQLKYLSALQYVDAVVGNSSSGFTEAPSFKIATINIGDRQRGRAKSESIIDCNPEKESIIKAFEIIYSEEFKNKLKHVKNVYGEGGASLKIKEHLKNVDLSNILKKKFFDLKQKS
jgi:GDP/UDP-N,N'-diacetylbacillosamine 2-epimerase (hydrolysing)